MAQYEDKVLHELDGIKEYDNPMPGWLMAIWWGSLVFSGAYLIFYALSFGEGTMEAEYRQQREQTVTAVQAHFDANPIVPPAPADLLAGAGDQAVVEAGAARFTRSCAACHGERAQGLIGPNLTDEHWLHGGSVEQIFQTVAKGWPSKGMPPWGRALSRDELAAVVSYVRSVQGSNPPSARPPEGERFVAERIPGS
jgi:cytochrome c oxidase cbb3-type subunit 3